MKILFLDDSKERTKYFVSRVPSAINGFSAQEIINKISKEKEVDILFLDADLNGGHYEDMNNANSGMEVVRFLEKNKINIKKIIIHSHNHIAAPEMVLRLKNVKYNSLHIPFLELQNDNILKNVLL